MIDKDAKEKIVIYGAGAIGSTVFAWLLPYYRNLFLLARGKNLEKLRSKGLTIYKQHKKDKAVTYSGIKIIEDIAEVSDPDFIIISVKNYNLTEVCEDIKSKISNEGSEPIIIALQNAINNQELLPEYFSKIVYGIVCYNAWRDDYGVVGYQHKAPIVLGTIQNQHPEERRKAYEILSKGLPTEITDELQDAARSKMLVNLTNSVVTLVGHGIKKISSINALRKIISNLMNEGIQILKKAGYHEVRLGNMPSWRTVTFGMKLPGFISNIVFKKNISKMVRSSMAYDIIIAKKQKSELDSLNGYFVQLAEKVGFNSKYNRKFYELCKKEFTKPDFEPLDVELVWKKISE
ncbi:MAG: 2-dehydropantoate 2-reductase [Candidatus Lokiarchaeota archaeon]|nr:2-dehydropantoate 2-reductase [Candidatus Lokiarchaeota archaeon]